MFLNENFMNLYEKLTELNEELLEDSDNNSVGTTSYSVNVTWADKDAEKLGIPYDQALEEIIKFISTLDKKEKENFELWWWRDKNKPGDKAGEVVMNLDPPAYYFKKLKYDLYQYQQENLADPVNRLIDVDSEPGSYEKVVAALRS